ncbi:MAG: hypothetical protein KGJ55_11950, partial [Gammaproteobacteria bacterium]|nr:hypothetical protein [Gammaproteobacteria bacterium]
TPDALILTAALLGLFVLAGGGYGGLYSVGRLRSSHRLRVTGYALYAVQAALLLAVWLLTPLFVFWKVFITLSWLAYGVIPPVTCKYLEGLHRTTGEAT